MTEQERFDRCLGEVLRLEGGYADDPRDPGGQTKFGITRATLSRALGRPALAQEVAALTPEAAGGIYRHGYWRPMRCGDLPAGLDLAVFDMAVNMGPPTGARLLQRALGVEADGAIGPATLAAAAQAQGPQAIRSMSALRRERYRDMAGFAAFGSGWLRRTDTVEALALAWAEAREPAEAGLA